MESNFKRKLTFGLFWSLMGTVLSKVFIMIAAIVTSRMLGADKNGEFGIINNTVVMFSTFAALGLGTTATKFVAEFKYKEKVRCGKIIGITNLFALGSGLLMGVLLFFSADWLAENSLNNLNIISGLKISSLLLVFNTVNTVQISTVSGFEDFKGIAKLTVFQGLISFPLFVFFTYYFNVDGLVIGYIIVSMLLCLMYRIKILQLTKKMEIRINYKHCFSELHILWKFSIPSMLANIMFGPVTWLGNTFIINTVNGYAALGVFNAANQWKSALTLIPTAIGNVILPMIVSEGNNEKLNKINMTLSFLIVSLMSIPLLLFPNLITFLYGKSYAGIEFDISVSLVAITSCFLAYKEGISRNLVSKNLMWFGFLSNTLWALSFIAFVWLFRDWGSVGLSLGFFLSYLISTVVFVPFYIKKGIAKKEFLFSRRINTLWVLLVICILCTVFQVNLIVSIIIMILTVGAWIFNLDDIINIPTVMQRIKHIIKRGT